MIPKFHAQILGGRIKLYKGEARLFKDHLLTFEFCKDVSSLKAESILATTIP
jgi:hypothetical protein